MSRRNFVAGAGAVGATVALAGCSEATSGISPNPVVPPPAVTPTVLGDSDYLNFALNLEYLEANYYLLAATGNGLAAANTTGINNNSTSTTGGSVSGGAQVPQANLTTAQINIMNEIAFDEQQHVLFLRSALGSLAVAQPALDLGTSAIAGSSGTAFSALATAAGIKLASGAPFNPYADFNSFLVGAFIFEDVGVTAYSGAAPALTSATLLNYAAGIQAVEAYHAAYIRTILTANATSQGTTAYPYLGYANQIAALRQAVGGTASVPQETTLLVPTLNTTTGAITPSSIVNATAANAIAYARTTDQVLHVVYGGADGAGIGAGTFFPSGLNGKIYVTQS